jgi:hypothetical protein
VEPELESELVGGGATGGALGVVTVIVFPGRSGVPEGGETAITVERVSDPCTVLPTACLTLYPAALSFFVALAREDPRTSGTSGKATDTVSTIFDRASTSVPAAGASESTLSGRSFENFSRTRMRRPRSSRVATADAMRWPVREGTRIAAGLADGDVVDVALPWGVPSAVEHAVIKEHSAARAIEVTQVAPGRSPSRAFALMARRTLREAGRVRKPRRTYAVMVFLASRGKRRGAWVVPRRTDV